MTSPVLEVRPGALKDMASASLFVLDIDGVILDPEPSFYLAARQTADEAAARALGRADFVGISEDDVGSFKAVGGFNDDYDLACGAAWAVIARETLDSAPSIATIAGWSEGEGLARLIGEVSKRLDPASLAAANEHCAPKQVRERCAARYSGKNHCHELYGIDPKLHSDLSDDGLWHLEPLLADSELLQKLPVPLAFCTGRNFGETLLAHRRHELSIPEEYWMVDDGVLPKKPAPDGLVTLAKLVQASLRGELGGDGAEPESVKASGSASGRAVASAESEEPVESADSVESRASSKTAESGSAGGSGESEDAREAGQSRAMDSSTSPQTQPGPLVFVGDSVDDQRAALAYRNLAESSPDLGLPPIIFIRVISAAATGTSADEAIEAGADVVVTSLNPLIRQVYFGASS